MPAGGGHSPIAFLDAVAGERGQEDPHAGLLHERVADVENRRGDARQPEAKETLKAAFAAQPGLRMLTPCAWRSWGYCVDGRARASSPSATAATTGHASVTRSGATGQATSQRPISAVGHCTG